MNVLLEPKSVEDRAVRSLLEVYDLQSGTRTVLQKFDYLIEAPNWEPSGESMVYNSRGSLYRLNLNTLVSERINAEFCTHCNNDHVLSSDGQYVAVSHHTREDGESRIYTLPITGGTPTLITPIAPSYLHGWSPDGSLLAYCAERNGQYDVYTIPAKGGVEKQLTNTPGLDDGPEFSPCGNYIWFNSVRSGLMQIWRMKVDGSEQRQMTDDGKNDWFAHLSPDGTKVIFISYKKGDVAPGDHPANKNVEIRMMDADGSNVQTLISLFGGQGSLNVNSWSPDGTRFAFVSYELK
ncbi:MAG TPA: transporter [Paludibacteraceae bacterium]|jgi:Tol biopolymer transport system component|nr:transporter [Paludibacteraceae bacterium]HPH63121.1 transporter [Paludibacteraceae bacterium]